MQQPKELPLIKVVGVSGSGKSTLVQGLRAAGYDARPVSQEHSNMPNLWQHFARPRVLIYLYVDVAHQRMRQVDDSWSEQTMAEELSRLAHAYDHADLRIDTSNLSTEQVLQVALTYLKHERIRRSDVPLPPLPATGSPRTQTR
jgi:RNase adaptor protein for sRNA GlmZ degradation